MKNRWKNSMFFEMDPWLVETRIWYKHARPMANKDEWRLRLSSVCLFRIEYNIIFVSSAMERTTSKPSLKRLHLNDTWVQEIERYMKTICGSKDSETTSKKLAQIVGKYSPSPIFSIIIHFSVLNLEIILFCSEDEAKKSIFPYRQGVTTTLEFYFPNMWLIKSSVFQRWNGYYRTSIWTGRRKNVVVSYCVFSLLFSIRMCL